MLLISTFPRSSDIQRDELTRTAGIQLAPVGANRGILRELDQADAGSAAKAIPSAAVRDCVTHA